MFHLSVKPISRSAGRSATAAAAYRAGELIADERTGELHDYTSKRDIEHSEIVLPAGAPFWAEDRQMLWNAAEAAEKRKDARVARDYEVAIPKELTRKQGIGLVRDFATSLVERYGVAIDFNVHRDEMRTWDGSEKGAQWYHAHVLASTRKLGPDGFGDKASIELSDGKRKSLGLGAGAEEIERIRQMWEVAANRHLEQANQAQRIDRRSLKDQGIDRVPTIHLGPHATGLEREGKASRFGDINREILQDQEVRLAVQKLDDEIGQIKAQIDQPAEVKRKRQAAKAQKPSGYDFSDLEQFKRAQEKQELEKQEQENFKQQGAAGWVALRQAPAPVPVLVPVVDLGAELDRITHERDLRVHAVLAKARRREERRTEALKRITAASPERPKGLFSSFQQKGHEATVAAWDRARGMAWRLAKEATRLAERLREHLRPERVREWATDVVRRAWPAEWVQVGQDLIARQAKLAEPTRQEAARTPNPEPIQSRPAQPPQPVPQASLDPARLRRMWERAQTLSRNANTQPLGLQEKIDVARGYEALVALIETGQVQPSADQIRELEKKRQEAKRQADAARFLGMARDAVLGDRPKLEWAYQVLDHVERTLDGQGMTGRGKSLALEAVRQKVAQSIESGKPPSSRDRAAVRDEPSRDPGQGPEREM